VNDIYFIPIFLICAIFCAATIRQAMKTGNLEFEAFYVEKARNPFGYKLLLALVWFWLVFCLLVPMLILMGWKGL
jgi:hypothetical protein